MLQTWEMIVFVIYGIPCVSLYIFVLFQLFYNPSLKSPFFTLAIVLGFVDLTNYIMGWINLKLILSPLTSAIFFSFDAPFVLCFIQFLAYYSSKVREELLLSTSFNRFTALCFPFKQQKIWSLILWPIVGLCFFLPFCVTFQNLFASCEIWPFSFDYNGSYVIIVQPSITFLRRSSGLINATHTIVTSLLSLMFNCLSLLNLYNKTKKAKRNNNNVRISNVAVNNAEINLFMVAIFDFFVALLAAFHQLLAYSFSIQNSYYNPVFDALYLSTPWMIDLVNLSRPFILIGMCQQIRKTFKFPCKSKVETAQISNITTVFPMFEIQLFENGKNLFNQKSPTIT